MRAYPPGPISWTKPVNELFYTNTMMQEKMKLKMHTYHFTYMVRCEKSAYKDIK
jgi:hypothetical protein